MNFVDHVALIVKAGRGGDGLVHFRREKFMPRGGPDGGDGGNGGSVIFKAASAKQTLAHLAGINTVKAEAGMPGGVNRRTGKSGEDELITVPLGTQISDADTKQIIIDLLNEGQDYVLAKGGVGGRGNWHFKSSINQAPKEFEEGTAAEERRVELSLKLIADIGIIGLPNAGKSTLLNILTRAGAKVGSYPFTTINPNLGVLKWHDKEVVLADIPGLIEGAAKGKGLGHEFLRHIERTRLLLHLVSADTDDPFKAYKTIKEELTGYSDILANKMELIVVSKSELITVENKAEFKKFEKLIKQPLIYISATTHQGLEDLIKNILKTLDKL